MICREDEVSDRVTMWVRWTLKTGLASPIRMGAELTRGLDFRFTGGLGRGDLHVNGC